MVDSEVIHSSGDQLIALLQKTDDHIKSIMPGLQDTDDLESVMDSIAYVYCELSWWFFGENWSEWTHCQVDGLIRLAPEPLRDRLYEAVGMEPVEWTMPGLMPGSDIPDEDEEDQ